MKISIGSDHAGFALKEVLKRHLAGLGHELTDCGAFSADRTDYPDFAKKVAEGVSSGDSERGVLVCGSGIGMCITANRFRGVRAVVLRDERDAELSRSHNDANVACFGERFTKSGDAAGFLDLFMSTPFEGGRHEARVAKMELKPV